jgi:predicted HTH domain antitoxin
MMGTRRWRSTLETERLRTRMLDLGIHRNMALDLYESGQATLAQAAKFANLSVEGFIELLGKAGVSAVSYSPDELAGELEIAR